MVDLARRCHGDPVAVRAEEGEGRVKWRVHGRVVRRWLEVEDNGSGVRPATARGRAIRDPATWLGDALHKIAAFIGGGASVAKAQLGRQ